MWIRNKHIELRAIRNNKKSSAAGSLMLLIRCIKMGYHGYISLSRVFFLDVLAQNCVMLLLVWLIFKIVTKGFEAFNNSISLLSLDE